MIIIAILAGFAFPVYNMVLYRARATDAASMINQLTVALKSYQNDYGDWPPAILTNTNFTGDAYIIASTNQNNVPASVSSLWTDLYRTLIGWPGGTATQTNFLNSNNSRRTVYIQIPQKYLNVQNASNFTTVTTFYDPWLREYNLAADVNGDNILAGLPQTTSGAGMNTNLTVNATLAIWSYGGTPTNASLYIVNWK